MKRGFFFIFLLTFFIGCDSKEEHIAVPISPLIKEVVMPSESESLPNSIVKIKGKGFTAEDVIRLINSNSTLDVEVISSSDFDIEIRIPREAEGAYTIQVERDGKTSLLTGNFKVPAVVVIDELLVPNQIVNNGGTVLISGNGFEANDKIFLSNSSYGSNVEVPANFTLDSDGVQLQIPTTVYGENRIIIKRDRKMSVLGNLKISVSVGDIVGGGIVYYVTNGGINGLIASKVNVGSAAEMFGPGVVLAQAAGTSSSLGSGKANTSKILQYIKNFRNNNPSSVWSTSKGAAELCDDYIVTEGIFEFDDWFLPSQEELKELFLQKSILSNKGFAISPNNYWSSTEGTGDTAGWAAFYVNFYESVTYVSGNVDKEGWKIGVRPIRSF